MNLSAGRASGGHRAVEQEGPGGAPEPEEISGSPDWRFLAVAGVIVAAALCLRLYRIAGQDLWLDEAVSWDMATTPKLLPALLISNSPPFYYLLLRAWVGLAGESEAALRLLSAMAGTLFVAVVLWTGREIFDTRVALWSGGAAALLPLHIYYSQEARAYAMLVFFLLLTHVLVWRALRRDTWLRWALVTASALLALYTHYFAIFGLLPGAFLLWLWPGRAHRWRYAAAMLASGLCFLPWVVWSFGLTPRSYAGVDWIRRTWENTPPWLAIPRSLEFFGLGGQAGLCLIFLKQFTSMDFPLGLRLLGLLMLGLLGLWVAVPWGDQNLGVPGLRERKAWLGLLLFLPLGTLWLLSLFKPFYAVGRYDLVGFAGYPLLLGLALGKAQRVKTLGTVLAPIMALLLLLPIGSKLFRYYQAPPFDLGPDARATAQVLDAGVANGGIVVFTHQRGLPVLYYLGRLGYRWDAGECRDPRSGRRFGCRLYPRETEQMPGVLDTRRVLASPDAVRADVEDFVRALPPQEGAAWVVFGFGSFSRDRLILSEPDVLLVRELQRLGMELSPVNLPLGIFQFRRP